MSKKNEKLSMKDVIDAIVPNISDRAFNGCTSLTTHSVITGIKSSIMDERNMKFNIQKVKAAFEEIGNDFGLQPSFWEMEDHIINGFLDAHYKKSQNITYSHQRGKRCKETKAILANERLFRKILKENQIGTVKGSIYV